MSREPVVQVGSWNPNKKHSEKERWICIYPAYINSKKTLAQGRKIPKDKCVDNPSFQEIRDVCVAAGLNVISENKLYSRERSKEIQFRGRVRVQIKNDDGEPLLENFTTREDVMFHVSKMIPKLKTRQPKQDGHSGGQGGTGGGKKKGKGRR